MPRELERRELLKLMGLGGGIVFASRLAGCASDSSSPQADSGAARESMSRDAGAQARGPDSDFYFVQVSDTHWGFSGAMVNPDAALELGSVVSAINSLQNKPDFVVFTGDLTHTTDSADERRKRMREFHDIVSALDVPMVKLMPGEHDAAPDAGAAYQELFGDMFYSFDHKGIHFVVLDNVSDPMAKLGDAQLSWFKDDLAALDRNAPIVVFVHRPLWDLKPEWDWATADGQAAVDIMLPYRNVTVFFGHIHQELHHMTGHISHHAARSTMFALPTPETPGKRNPVSWDPDHPEAGLGYRHVEAKLEAGQYDLTEIPLAHPEAAP